MKNVDIIVPIYNAYEYTKECIKSVLKYTDLISNSLILINDKSPDEKILPMLEKYKKENSDKNIIVLDNQENLGFVKTVNKGMKYSKNDVILLNSDTEVTKKWLKKLQECAYSNEYIATVTPFTNNGTIFSIPNFGVDNQIPEGFEVDEFADLVERCSEKRFPEVTTGNGYCMYIKRNILDEIGLFDDITFEKGFGEENDFCYRALDYGYINVLCDDTFIYHKGTQSFKVENMTQARIELVKNHMERLRKKYPIYVQKTDNFISNNPFKEIQENININLNIYKKKKILYLINEWQEDMKMTGGTSLHLKDIINKVKYDMACFVLSPNKYDISTFDLYLYTDKCGRKINSFKLPIADYGLTVYTNSSYKEMLNMLFETYKFDIVHVQHLLFHTFDICDISEKYNTFKIISLHDLYMICPSINMVFEDRYCEVNKKRDCVQCLKGRYGITNNIVDNWRLNCYKILKRFNKIIVPSENTKNIFLQRYKDLQIDLIEHGTEVINIKNNKHIDSKDFKIAFVGVMVPHKGSIILKEMVKNNNNFKIQIHLFGKTDDEFLKTNKNGFYYHGPYKRKDLPKLLVENKIDMVCILSTVPETYSYTLTESFMSRVPVLAFNIGAIQDRIKNNNLGWIIDLNTEPKKILSKIEEISQDSDEYDKIKENFTNYKFKTTEEMQKEYMKIYNDVHNLEMSDIVNTYELMKYQKENTAYQYQIYTNTYGHIVEKYEKMRSTKLWKILKKIKRKIRGSK